MTYEDAYRIFGKLINNEIVTQVMIDELNGYIQFLITRMKDEVISMDEQSLLDLYINYLRLNLTDMDIVEKYDKVVEEKNSPIFNEEHKAQKEGHHKVLLMEKRSRINNNGVIISTIIIEVALLLGLTTAILILALS